MTTFYIGYDLKLISTTAYTGINRIQAGTFFGEWQGRGVNLFITYFNGNSIHGEYYYETTSYWGTGFLIQF
jgi:hypothetical protein